MAGFTTLALLGLVGAAGLAGGKKIGAAQQKKADAPVTPGPSSAQTIAAPAPPPSQSSSSSTAAKAGQQAATKLKKRLNSRRPMSLMETGSSIAAPTPLVRKPTLIGGGY